MGKTRRSPRTAKDRAMDEIYAEIPSVPACSGACAEACTLISMFEGEWDRVKRSKGYTPRQHPRRLACPMLSPTGRCTVYTVRPYICRLWGTTPELACPNGCQPERWVTSAEAADIFERLMAVAGPGTDGPLGSVENLWEMIALPQRAARSALMDKIREARRLIDEVKEDSSGNA